MKAIERVYLSAINNLGLPSSVPTTFPQIITVLHFFLSQHPQHDKIFNVLQKHPKAPPKKSLFSSPVPKHTSKDPPTLIFGSFLGQRPAPNVFFLGHLWNVLSPAFDPDKVTTIESGSRTAKQRASFSPNKRKKLPRLLRSHQLSQTTGAWCRPNFLPEQVRMFSLSQSLLRKSLSRALLKLGKARAMSIFRPRCDATHLRWRAGFGDGSGVFPRNIWSLWWFGVADHGLLCSVVIFTRPRLQVRLLCCCVIEGKFVTRTNAHTNTR